jgi:hypothetical protein
VRYSRPPGPGLATILIISAIDVLLCSFTAGLTLFFFSPSPPERASALSAAIGINKGGGADGVRIIIRNEADSDLQYVGGVNQEVVATTEGHGISVLRLKALPSIENPVWLGTKKACIEPCQIPLLATVYVIRNGNRASPRPQRIGCVTHRSDGAAIIDADNPVVTLSNCDSAGGGSPEASALQADLIRVLDQRSRERRK